MSNPTRAIAIFCGIGAACADARDGTAAVADDLAI